ncbi:helix-turn-helix transcriptional regulator [Streptomyces sp. NPDC017940]|uniref:helix-turn-helix transcriptional regulator n=1 Tax=Streptomyces sp. NPDC017940 TaxID=3365017 RepID=UPI00379ACE92
MFGLPPEVGLREAAEALNLSLTTAYRQVRNGSFPCPVRSAGRRYVVRLSDLLRALGIQEVRVRYDDIEAGARVAAGEVDI